MLLSGWTVGNPSGQPILCVHGWLDNANSFKPLATALDLDKYRLISMDLPGHGLSEHFPSGVNYSVADSLAVLLRAIVR